MITLTSGPAFIVPVALSDYSANPEGGPLTHAVLGRRTPDVTVRPLTLRRGGFTLDFTSAALSRAALDQLTAARVWTLTHSTAPTLDMEFIVTGLSQGVDGTGRWPVTVSFEEIS